MFSWNHFTQRRQTASIQKRSWHVLASLILFLAVACQSIQDPLPPAWDIEGTEETGSALVQGHALQLTLRANKPEALVQVLLQDTLVQDFDIEVAFDQFRASSSGVTLLAQLTTLDGSLVAKAALATLPSSGHTRGLSVWIPKSTGDIAEQEPTGSSGGSIRIRRTQHHLELSMLAEGGTPFVLVSDPDFGTNPLHFKIQFANKDLFMTTDAAEDSHVRIHRLAVDHGSGQHVPDLLEQDLNIPLKK